MVFKIQNQSRTQVQHRVPDGGESNSPGGRPGPDGTPITPGSDPLRQQAGPGTIPKPHSPTPTSVVLGGAPNTKPLSYADLNRIVADNSVGDVQKNWKTDPSQPGIYKSEGRLYAAIPDGEDQYAVEVRQAGERYEVMNGGSDESAGVFFKFGADKQLVIDVPADQALKKNEIENTWSLKSFDSVQETTPGTAPRVHNNVKFDSQRVREVTYIGVGSSVAYQLNGLRDFSPDVTIVGHQDAWSPEVRGAGEINHQAEIIDQWGKHVPPYDPNYADREKFAAGNAKQIEKAENAGAERIKENVVGIKRLDNSNFQITLDGGNIFESKRVVLGTGAGPHTSVWKAGDQPTRAEGQLRNINLKEQKTLREQGTVLDLDEFMRATDADPERFKGKKVVVHGPNAGIDAVERGGKVGADVTWFIRSTPPVLLDGNQLQFAPATAQNALLKVNEVEVSPATDGGIAIKYSEPNAVPNAPQNEFKADFYVYALGQDPDKPGSVGNMLGELSKDLEPIYDRNQVYSDKPYETVLGLQIKGANPEQGLIIVGAAAPQLAPQVKHTYVEHSQEGVIEAAGNIGGEHSEVLTQAIRNGESRDSVNAQIAAWKSALNNRGGHDASKFNVLENRIADYYDAKAHFDKSDPRQGVTREMNKQIETEVSSVVVTPQLGTVKASAAAMHAVLPPYIANGEASYTTDNRTILRTHIANKYSNVGNQQATAFIDAVIRLRHMKSDDFVKWAATDVVKSEVGPLLSSGATPKTVDARLAELGISADTRSAAVKLAGLPSQSQDASREALLSRIEAELRARFASGRTPVHGTPDAVRVGYESQLAKMDRGQGGDFSLAKYWLRVSGILGKPNGESFATDGPGSPPI